MLLPRRISRMAPLPWRISASEVPPIIVAGSVPDTCRTPWESVAWKIALLSVKETPKPSAQAALAVEMMACPVRMAA